MSDLTAEQLAASVVFVTSEVMATMRSQGIAPSVVHDIALSHLEQAIADNPVLEQLAPAGCSAPGCRRRPHPFQVDAHVSYAGWAADRRDREVA